MTKANTGHGNTGYGNSGHGNTGYGNSGHRNAGDWNTGYGSAGYRNGGGMNAGDWNTGNQNSGKQNSGNQNSGHGNSGDWNSGDWNSGDFNSDSPNTFRCFNKECLRDVWVAAEKPAWLFKPSPTSWIVEDEMSEQEKLDNKTHGTSGGYLRLNNWGEEWAKALSGASEEDVQKVRDLPNFDYDIFEEITGLDIRPVDGVPDSSGKVIEIDGVKYTLTKV